MKINNVDVQAMGAFAEQAKANPALLKKQKRVDGEWVFAEGQPQFRAKLAYPKGEALVPADFAPFMGGGGLAPDPIQYCLYGMAACFAGTFVALAAARGIALRRLAVAAQNQVDLSRPLGLGDNPIVERVSLTLTVESDASAETLATLEAEARASCPGVYCLTNPIPLDTRVVRAT